MIPVAAGGLVIGILGTVGLNKWNESRKIKMTDQDIAEDEALTAEELLMQKMQEAKEDGMGQVGEDAVGAEEG